MAQRPRTVHPDDAQDERLASLPLTAAYTYVYLPTVLDDAGRAKDQPAVLNGYLWPLRADEHNTAAMAGDLDALVAAGLLCRYTVDGQSYLHDPQWRTRQQVARPDPSLLPPCPVHDTAVNDLVGDTLRKLSEQISSFVGSTRPTFDEAKIRDAVSRAVEDVSFLIDPEKAMSYGQRVRDFLDEMTQQPRSVDRTHTNVWDDVTDEPDGAVSPDVAGLDDGAEPGSGEDAGPTR